jgi:hypothetical protein
VSLSFKRRSCSIINKNIGLFNKIRLNAYRDFIFIHFFFYPVNPVNPV